MLKLVNKKQKGKTKGKTKMEEEWVAMEKRQHNKTKRKDK